MFVRSTHFSRFATLAIIFTISLASILVAAFAPARAEAMLCNRSGALLAHGFRYAPAGNAMFEYDAAGNLVVSNIGNSGQDGFCMRGIAVDGVERVFEPITLSSPDAEMIWQVRSQAEKRFALTSFRESGGAVDMSYDDDVIQGSTRTLAILGGPITGTVTVSPGGPVATLQSTNGVSLITAGFNRLLDTPMGSNIDVWEHAYFTFSEPVSVIVGDQTFTGDRISILREEAFTVDSRPEIGVFKNLSNPSVTILDTAFHLWGRTHRSLSESFLIRKLPTNPLTMRGFGEPQILATNIALHPFPSDEYRYDFAEPVQIAEMGDQMGLSGWSGEEGQEILLGRLEITTGGITPPNFQLRAAFPACGDSVVSWEVKRDGQVILETTLPDGEGLDVARPLAVSRYAWDYQGNASYDAIRAEFRIQGSSSIFEVRVEPTAELCHEVQTTRLESTEQMFTFELSGPGLNQ